MLNNTMAGTAHRILTLVLCAIPVVITQRCPDHRRVLFGVRLSKQAAAMVEDVEKGYGRRIREDTIEHPDDAVIMNSGVDDDGTPLMRVSPLKHATEVDIVHEAFHLKLKLDGFPTWWETRTPRALHIDPAQIKEVMTAYAANLYSPLEHMLFYPEMRRMGYEPSERAVSPTKDHLLAYPQRLTDLDNLNLAITYLTIFLEFRPQDREAIEGIYRDRRWEHAVVEGEKLRSIARESAPMTANSIVVAFARCMTLLSGETTYEFDGWADKKAGEKRVFKVGILKARPTANPNAQF